MQFITQFLNKVGGIIESLVSFIIDFFTGLIDFFSDIPVHITRITDAIQFLPAPLVSIALVVLAAQLIFIIIGRRGV